MNDRHGPPEAIVIGSGINALGVVRSLGQGGLRVASVSQRPTDPPQRSRFASMRVQAPSSGQTLLGKIDALVATAAKPAVLFVTEEDTVQFLAEQRLSFHPNAICRLPSPDVLLTLLDKNRFDDVCRQYGFAVPRSFTVTRDGALSLPDGVRFPLIVKPATKTPDYGRHFKKAYIVQSPAEVAEIARRIAEAVGEAIVQEWIPGGDSQIFFCLQYVDETGPVASFVGRKLRSWPPMFGGTASCTVAPPELRDTLSRLTTDFFSRTGFQGMGSMEFKVDSRDGTPYLIEPTVGRTDFQEEVATLHGINLPLTAYCRETGRSLPPLDYRRGARVWIDTSGEPRLSVAARMQSAIFQTNAVWRWSDPFPGIGMFRDRLEGFARRRLHSR